MDAVEFEHILRRVVREELAALLGGPAPVAVERQEAVVDRFHPFLLSEAELSQAEQLLPEAERPILRKRVYAARLEKMGNQAGAARMRRQADLLAQALPGVAA